MKSFKIANGDLVIGTSGFDEVQGEDKVRQDLGIAVREPFGCDRFHPDWGSLLHTYVGGPVTQEVEALVQAEVVRIIANYVAIQQAVLARDSLDARKARYSSNEVIREIKSIEVIQQFDALHIRVKVETLTSGEIVLTSSARV